MVKIPMLLAGLIALAAFLVPASHSHLMGSNEMDITVGGCTVTDYDVCMKYNDGSEECHLCKGWTFGSTSFSTQCDSYGENDHCVSMSGEPGCKMCGTCDNDCGGTKSRWISTTNCDNEVWDQSSCTRTYTHADEENCTDPC